MLSGELAKKYLDEFPNESTNGLAKKMYKENPGVWKSLDSARSALRGYRGVMGKKNRKEIIARKHFKEPYAPLKVPEPKKMKPWGIRKLRMKKTLILADVHAPYYDKEALQLALNYGIDHGCEDLLLNGDFIDNFSISHWERDPRLRDFPGELEITKELLHLLSEKFNRKIYKMGNHDEWYEKYMINSAPELLDVADFQFENILKLKDYGYECIGDKQPLEINNLKIIHGHEYCFSISNPVNPARGLYLRAKESSMCGHFHQTSEHSEGRMSGKIITCWSSGCLCYLHPNYRPLNKWNHGFSIIDTSEDGIYSVENKRIINYKVV